MHEIKKYKVTVAYWGEVPIIEEVVACSMKFAVKDWFCVSFFDKTGRLIKEYFKEVLAVEPIYSE